MNDDSVEHRKGLQKIKPLIFFLHFSDAMERFRSECELLFSSYSVVVVWCLNSNDLPSLRPSPVLNSIKL